MKTTNKKQYDSPTTDVVELRLENSVLTGSNDGDGLQDYFYGNEEIW